MDNGKRRSIVLIQTIIKYEYLCYTQNKLFREDFIFQFIYNEYNGDRIY